MRILTDKHGVVKLNVDGEVATMRQGIYEIVSRDWSSDVCSSDLMQISHRFL